MHSCKVFWRQSSSRRRMSSTILKCNVLCRYRRLRNSSIRMIRRRTRLYRKSIQPSFRLVGMSTLCLVNCKWRRRSYSQRHDRDNRRCSFPFVHNTQARTGMRWVYPCNVRRYCKHTNLSIRHRLLCFLCTWLWLRIYRRHWHNRVCIKCRIAWWNP